MARHYCVWIVTPLLYPHSAAFREVASSLDEALTELGNTVEVTSKKPLDSETNVIVLGANLLQGSLLPIPHYWTIYNLEQIAFNSPWFTDSYHKILCQARSVWDYSTANIEVLQTLGITARHVPIGYTSNLTRFREYNTDADIDVLHYGSLNERRSKILNDLKARGVNVMHLFNVYGDKRDGVIARSKIVLNMHFYPSKLFEIVRVSYLLANNACVVSERSADTEYEELLDGGVVFEDYDSLVYRCVSLLGDEHRRKTIAEEGYRRFSQLTLAPMLEEVLQS